MGESAKRQTAQVPPSARAAVTARLPARTIAAALLGLAAAWLAAGSTGLLGHALRHALSGAALAACLLVGWPTGQRNRLRVLLLLGAIAAAIPMAASTLTPVNVSAVALLLTTLAFAQTRPDARRAISLIAQAVFLLALFRLACSSIPWFWLAADDLGQGLGRAAGLLSGLELWVGATYAGLDFLLPMLHLALMAPWQLTEPGQRRPARHVAVQTAAAVAAVLFLQIYYLVAVAAVGPTTQTPPQAPAPPTFQDQVNPLPTTFAEVARQWLPWNLPALAAVLQLSLVGVGLFLRWGNPAPDDDEAAPDETDVEVAATRKSSKRKPAVDPNLIETPPAWLGWLPLLRDASMIFLAALLPLVSTLCLGGNSLVGKKVVLFEKGFLNWLRPQHGDYGRLSIGMYGTMPDYLRSLGATPLVSKDLSEEDLKDASVLILFFPSDPWEEVEKDEIGKEGKNEAKEEEAERKAKEAIGRLERIKNFVRQGGTLAVFGEHTITESPPKILVGTIVGSSSCCLSAAAFGEASCPSSVLPVASAWLPSLRLFGSRFNDVLEPTAMQVRFDSATFAVGGWLQSYDTLAHPTTSGIGDDRNEFGVVIGASVETRFPARPLLIGRYGWADPGDMNGGPAKMGNHTYDFGEKLGDLVLAAEQPLGAGRVIAFGDTSGMTNGLTPGCHRFTSRLLSYMGDPSDSPFDAWRQVLAMAMLLGLVALLAARPRLVGVAGAAVALSAVLSVSTAVSYHACEVIPDGTRIERPPSPAGNLPDGTRIESPPSPAGFLAYVDASHAGVYAPESWRDDGTMGMAMTLMRNGYLTLMLPELTRQRLLKPDATSDRIWDRKIPPADLLRTAVLVLIAPGKEYTPSERRLLRDFVRAGGTLICTVGYEEFGPIRSLLCGTDPLPLSPWGKDQPARHGGLLQDTDEYHWKYEQVFGATNNAALADSLATRFAAQFDRLRDTEEYQKRYDELLEEIRAKNLAARASSGQASSLGQLEPDSAQKDWAREYATAVAADFCEPYGDQVGFGFYVGALPPPPGQQPAEPNPLGHFKTGYFRGDNYEAYVRFHAAWPVYCDYTGAKVVAAHSSGTNIIMYRRYRRGLVVVVGDTGFAMNKNLEREGGQAFDGAYENADFWHWLLSLARGDVPPWIPPRPANVPQPADPPGPASPLVLPSELLPSPGERPPSVPNVDQSRRNP